MNELFLVIPAYNEAPLIGSTIANLPRRLEGIDRLTVVIVDDGSLDGTLEVAEQAVRARCAAEDAPGSSERFLLLRHPVNRGLGAALGTGFACARQYGATYVVTYDADGQHAPEDIAKVVAPLATGSADAVIGSRLLDPTGMPWYRIFGNWGLNVFTWGLYGLWTTDSQSGLRGFNRAALDRIQIRMDRMEVSSYLIREIRRNRLRYGEVGIKAIYTDYSLAKGQSNWNAFRILMRLILHRLLED